MTHSRRTFLQQGTLALGGFWLSARSAFGAGRGARQYRAAIIGRTGGGDYGHGYDQIFRGLDNVTVVAVADPNPDGLRQAAERSGAQRPYLDYRQMLGQERPDLVCIAPRHPDCHKAMALAAIGVGASLFVEKPFTETLADADAILAAADKKKVKIAVAHNRRWTAGFVRVRTLLAEGALGKIREVRIQGKQDRRAGGEDLLVLGTHDFDLMRFYFGDPLWCFASVTNAGKDVRPADARRGNEPVWVAGDTVHALFAFPHNLMVHWSSVTTGDQWNRSSSKREKWSFEIFGTKAIVAYQSGLEFAWLDSPFLAQPEGTPNWRRLPEPPGGSLPTGSAHPILDLIDAIETGRSPICSGDDGRWAVEMVSAVYQSHLKQARVPFPLRRRDHPLKA